MTPPDGAAVARRFGLGEVVAPLTFAARGELGRIWRMETVDGERFAVKQLLLDDPGDGRDDAGFQLAARRAGVPLPAPRAAPDHEVICRVGGVAVRVYDWVDLDPSGAVGEGRAGALLAGIHLLGHPAGGPMDPWYVDGVGPQRWDEVLTAASAAGPAWAEPLAALVPELLRAEDEVVLPAAASPPPPSTLVRGHLDFNPENVAVDVEGRAVVLDWENSGPTVPEREVGMALWDFATWGSGDRWDERAADFVAGYRDAGGRFDAGLGPSVFAMAFAVQAHLLEFYARRSLDESASPEDRSRSDRWLDEMTARPLTLPAAETVLSLVG